jgi:pilus assembly protein CpaB
MKGKAAIIISILFGILAWVFVWLYLTTRERELLQIADSRPVVVAATDILPGTAIEENMIAETEVPLKFVQPSAFTSARDAVGQIPAVPIQEGSQITGTSMTGVGRSLATKIPRGQRAVAIAVTDVTGVASLIRPSNYVDILATLKMGSGLGASDQRTVVATLFQNVLVLAVGNDTGEVAQRAPTEGDTIAALSNQNRDQRFTTVTVALTPKQVQDLTLAQEVGDLSFSLRSFREGEAALDIPRSNPSGAFGINDSELVPRRAPSWQEIRGNAR